MPSSATPPTATCRTNSRIADVRAGILALGSVLLGIIRLTTAAESSLHSISKRGHAALDHPDQRQQVSHPERASAGGHRYEHIRPGRVGPTHRKRVLPAIPVKKEHPV